MEVIVNVVVITTLSFRFFNVHGSKHFFAGTSAVDFFVFSFLGLATLLWSSLSSESAGRGVWIRQQNW